MADKPSEPLSGHLAECAFLQRSHLFRQVEEEDYPLLYEAGRLFHCNPGDVIIEENEIGGFLYLITQGDVQVVAQSPQGFVELAVLTRGAVFGEVAFLTGQPRTASCLALDDVKLIGFERKALEPVLKKYPKIRKLLQALTAARARKAIEITRT